MSEHEERRGRRRTAIRLDGGEEGGDCCGSSVSDRESRSERGRKEVAPTNERSRWSRRRVEERGVGMG